MNSSGTIRTSVTLRRDISMNPLVKGMATLWFERETLEGTYEVNTQGRGFFEVLAQEN